MPWLRRRGICPRAQGSEPVGVPTGTTGETLMAKGLGG
jgi:hypothetical protein